MQSSELRAVSGIALVVVEDKVVEFEFAAGLGLDLPEQKCAKGITLHEAIEQPFDLLRLPNELSLNGR
jgi:hypothetical protein